jgi:hypothetical protein
VLPSGSMDEPIRNFENDIEVRVYSRSSKNSDLDGNMFEHKILSKTKKQTDLHEHVMSKVKDELIDLYLSVKIRKNEEIDDYNSH